MSVKRIKEFPEGSGSLTNDDIFLFMDNPSGGGVTKKISLSEISSAIGGGGGGTSVVQLGNVSGVINTNASLGDIFDLNIMSSGTLANPSNPTDGQSLRWRITHKANNIPVSLGSNFKIPSSASNPLPFSSTSGTMDLLAATYDLDRNKWDVIAFVPGY
jgi:hypothetical protein